MAEKLVVLALALIAVGAATITMGASEDARAQAPTITVSPAAGNQFQTFTFAGQGFIPGAELEEAYYSPDGLRFVYYIGGAPAVVVVGDDGSFSVDVYPATDFEGAAPGTWTVEFCIRGTDICWSGTIEIWL